MTLWIGNGAVLKNSSQWQLKEYSKLNHSVHELFIFKIPTDSNLACILDRYKFCDLVKM